MKVGNKYIKIFSVIFIISMLCNAIIYADELSQTCNQVPGQTDIYVHSDIVGHNKSGSSNSTHNTDSAEYRSNQNSVTSSNKSGSWSVYTKDTSDSNYTGSCGYINTALYKEQKSKDRNQGFHGYNGYGFDITAAKLGEDNRLYIETIDRSGRREVMVYEDYKNATYKSYIRLADGSVIEHQISVGNGAQENEEWTETYYQWEMKNDSNPNSSYYGDFVAVARTHASSARISTDGEGTYIIKGTRHYKVRHWHIEQITHDDCIGEGENRNCNTWTEDIEVTDWIDEDRTKGSEFWTVSIPLIGNGCPIPDICINGACDCASDLHTVCPDSEQPALHIDSYTELEQ